MSVPRPPALAMLPSWRLRTRVLLAMASGLSCSLAFPPADVRAVAFVALVPFLLAVRGASVRDGAVAGAAFGVSFTGVLIAWVSVVGWLAWSALVLLQVVFITALGAFAAALSRGGAAGRVLGIPLLYTGVEMARARYPFGGFAWGLLGSSQHGGLPLLPLARAGGVFAVTLALCAVNALLAEVVTARRNSLRALAAAVALGVAVAPAALPLGAPRDGSTLDVAIVQGNVPHGYFEGLRRGRVGPEDEVIIANHVRLTETLAGDPPDLVVWPENALDRDPFTDQVARDGVDVALGLIRTPLLVGAILDGPRPDRFFNSTLLFAPDGTVLARYDKVRLVPFGEYVPWSWARGVVPGLDQVPTDGVPGRGPVVMELPSGDRIGSVICFESSYPQLTRELARRGAEMIVVATNTATFGRSPLARQHLALSRMRAVETGRPVVHAGIAGISAVIQPDGRIVRRAGLFVPAVLRQPVTLARGRTPYVEYGEITDAAMAAAAGACAAIAVLLAARRRPGGDIDDDDEAFWLAGRPAAAEADPPAVVAAGERGWEQRE